MILGRTKRAAAASSALLILIALGAQRARPAAGRRNPPPADFELIGGANIASPAREFNRTSAGPTRPPAPTGQRVELQAQGRHTSHKQQVQAEPLAMLGAGQVPGSQAEAAGSGRPAGAPSPAPLIGQAQYSNTSASLANVRAKWRRMEQALGSSLANVSSNLRHTLDELLAELQQQRQQQTLQDNKPRANISAQCRFALADYLSALAGQELWASQMLDSSATQLPSGLLQGTLTELGHFDQCLAVSSQRPAQSAGQSATAAAATPSAVLGQYCSLHIKPPLINRPRLHTICRRLPNLSSATGSPAPVAKFLAQNSHQFLYVGLRLGVCLPHRCSTSDVQALLSAYLQRFELIGQVKYCQQPERRAPELRADQADSMNFLLYHLQLAYNSSILPKFDLVQQCILAGFSLLFLLIALGTWLDTSHKRARLQPNLALASDLTSAARAPQTRADREGPRRWKEYQVCRSISTIGDSAGDPSAQLPAPPPLPPKSMQASLLYGESQQQQQHEQQQQLGLQRNPIAELVVAPWSTSDANTTQTPSPSTSSSSIILNEHELELLALDKHKTNAGLSKGNSGRRAWQKIAERQSGGKKAALGASGSDQQARDSRAPGRQQGAFKAILREFLVCFSLKSNLRTIGKLARVDGRKSAPGASANRMFADVKVVHGIRTLSMVCIIFGHTIGLVGPEMMNNLFPLAQLSCSSRLLQAILNSTLAVDTFFMISGLVTAISFVRKCSSATVLISTRQRPARNSDDLLVLRGASAAATAATTTTAKQANRFNLEQQQPQLAACGSASSSCDKLITQSRVIDLEEISSVDSASSASTSFSSAASSAQAAAAAPSDKAAGKNKDKRREREQKEAGAGGRRSQADHDESWWPADFKPLMWLLMRYLRLTPAYATIIGLSILMPSLGSGPFWAETVGQMGPACRENGWINLLYLNNFLETDRLCLIHSWYLSNDWQFFIITLLLFATAYKSKKLTLLLILSMMLASSAATFVSTVENEFPPTIVTTSPAVAERWQFIYQLYYKPWPHLPSYLIGLLLGYQLLKLEISQKQHQMSAGARYACWTLFSLLGLAVLNSIYPWNMGFDVDPILTGLHSSTFRTLWATCCAWLVYALVTRPRNPLALFLAWHGFQVTSRLTYCAYLVHPLIIYYHFGTLRERLDSSPYGQLHRFMATLAQSYLFALVLSILIEGPSIQLQRFIARLSGIGAASGSGDSANDANNNPDPEPKSSAAQQLEARWALANNREPAKKASGPLNFSQFVAPAQQSEHLISRMCNNKLVGADRQDKPVCQLHGRPPPQDGRCPSSESSSHSAIDLEFQKKLAQAIGRGFKIRTKIVNGTIRNNQAPARHQAARRLGPAKRANNHNRAGLPPVLRAPVHDSNSNQQADDNNAVAFGAPDPPPDKPAAVARRAGEPTSLSTFLAGQQYVRPTSRKTVEELRPPDGGKQSHLALAVDRASVDFNEMIQMKHRLLSRQSQDQEKSVV